MVKRLYGFLAAMLVVAFSCGLAWGQEPAAPELTLNQALEMAEKYSKNLRKARLEVDRAGELRSYRSEQVDYVPLEPPNNPLVEVAWSSLLAADLGWQMSKKSLGMEEDQLVLSVCQKYWDVLGAREKVGAKEAALKQADWDVRKAGMSAQVGMISPLTLSQAKAGYAGAQAEMAAAENELADAYSKLNQLLGLGPQDRPILVDTVEFHPVDAGDLDTAVRHVIENSPAVWLAQEKATMQKHLEDLMFYTGEYTPYKARQIEVKQAELDAVSAVDGTRLLTRSLYHNLVSLEEAYPALEEAVQIAAEALRIVNVRYELGMATKADVVAAEAALAGAEQAALEMRCQHAYLKLAFQKPWAMNLQ